MELIPLWLYEPVNITSGLFFSLSAIILHCLNIANAALIARQEKYIELQHLEIVIRNLEAREYACRSGMMQISKEEFFRLKQYIIFNVYQYYFIKEFTK